MANPPPNGITLHPCNVLFEAYNDIYVSGIGNVSVGEVLMIGSDVKDWDVGDVILYNKDFSNQFIARNKTYSVVHTDKVLLKYTLEEPQHRL